LERAAALAVCPLKIIHEHDDGAFLGDRDDDLCKRLEQPPRICAARRAGLG